mmetsp:Transcript_22872/g.91533  ORF Transcript_22872/g.91533 Transcript_22872/m.91533 type:complete len:107 (-) Transcript_22872:865-1185(-)
MGVAGCGLRSSDQELLRLALDRAWTIVEARYVLNKSKRLIREAVILQLSLKGVEGGLEAFCFLSFFGRTGWGAISGEMLEGLSPVYGIMFYVCRPWFGTTLQGRCS